MKNNITVEELMILNNVQFFEAIFTSTKEIALILDKVYDKKIKMC